MLSDRHALIIANGTPRAWATDAALVSGRVCAIMIL
jgi:hypothetical protein